MPDHWRFVRVTSERIDDGTWAGVAIAPRPGGTWHEGGPVVVVSGNGCAPQTGHIYAAESLAPPTWVVVVHPVAEPVVPENKAAA